MKVWQLSQLVPNAEKDKLELNKSLIFISGQKISENSIVTSLPTEIIFEILKIKTELYQEEDLSKKNLQIEIFKIESEQEYYKSMNEQIKMI